MTETVKELLSQLQVLNERDRTYLASYFADAPPWLLQALHLQQLKKGTIFIREDDPVETIFLLIKGHVRAVDYRILGIAYDYMRFEPIKAFGSMEILLERDVYKSTLSTYTDCLFLTVEKQKYEKWLKNDKNALLMEIKSMGTYLLDQAQKERAFLFLQGVDRMILLFIRLYEQEADKKKCQLRITRQELSENSGLSVKTVNRSIKQMEEKDYITKKGYTIEISQQQYGQMKAYIAEKMAASENKEVKTISKT